MSGTVVTRRYDCMRPKRSMIAASMRRSACAVWLCFLVAPCIAAEAKKGAVKVPAKTATRDKFDDRASVVLDKNCPTIVKPYRIEDNLVEIVRQAAPSAVDDAKGWLSKILGNGDAPLGTGFTSAVKVAAKRTNWLPMDAEVAYGAQGNLEQSPIVDRDSAAGRGLYAISDELLAGITGAIGEPHDYHFNLQVLGNDSRNGFALPGGFVYVDAGLISQQQYRSKAYFAVAHEIAHVLQRHETKELQARVIDSFSSGRELLATIKQVNSDPYVILLHVKAEKNRFTQHHIDEELQADSCAVRILARALPDRSALEAALRTFIVDLPKVQEVAPAPAASRGTKVDVMIADVDEIVNTPVARHPTNAERERNLQSMLDEISRPATTGLPAKKAR